MGYTFRQPERSHPSRWRSQLVVPPSGDELGLVRRLLATYDARDARAGEHFARVSAVAAHLAEAVGVSSVEAWRIRVAASLHDIGKLTVPSQILRKPGPLSAAERELVERHAENGHQMLVRSATPLFKLAATIAMTHHERWDGSGYPLGLRGYEVPLAGRIAGLADVFDALLSERPYRPAYDVAQAVALIAEGRGKGFDPAMVDALFSDLHGALAARSGASGSDGALVSSDPIAALGPAIGA